MTPLKPLFIGIIVFQRTYCLINLFFGIFRRINGYLLCFFVCFDIFVPTGCGIIDQSKFRVESISDSSSLTGSSSLLAMLFPLCTAIWLLNFRPPALFWEIRNLRHYYVVYRRIVFRTGKGKYKNLLFDS